MRMTVHFVWWKLIYHLFSHSSSADRSFWKSFESDWFLTCLYSKLSSANKRNVEVETTSGRSLMYTRNNSGPNTVPCGPPESTSSFADSHPSTSTCCVLEDKKSVIHCMVFHGLHSVKVYEVSAYAELCQTLWPNLGRWRQFDLLLISVSPQFLGWLILAVMRKIFGSESRVDSLSECHDGQDVSLSMNGQYVQVFCLLLM
jgi:hypothetical protein